MPDSIDADAIGGSETFRTMCGVINMTISVLSLVSPRTPNKAPRSGTSLSPGTPAAVFCSSSWISPASTSVSPSLSRIDVDVWRVPTL